MDRKALYIIALGYEGKLLHISYTLFRRKFQKSYSAENLLIMTHPIAVLCQQKYMCTVNWNFMIFYLKVIKEKISER